MRKAGLTGVVLVLTLTLVAFWWCNVRERMLWLLTL
ncbi:Uncharacterised protein [Mycobacterium tuberculosis]|nr:Uncharacterised protein [Mycobacterium tuberculosis]